MPMIRCSADEHYYDNKKHSECPFCRKTHMKSESNADKSASGKGERGVNDHTHQVHRSEKEEKRKTKVLWGNKGENPQLDEEQPPVVGWLVIVDGPGMGRDLRVNPGMNRIGRDTDMDLQLDFGDETVSRNEHAFLIYDLLNNAFFVKHGSGQNLIYLNGAMVMDATPLKAHDRIRVGKTELLFVPLCTDVFQWDGVG